MGNQFVQSYNTCDHLDNNGNCVPSNTLSSGSWWLAPNILGTYRYWTLNFTGG
jgi:hypothetical protein